MYKQQSYDIQASFLVPAYNLPSDKFSDYITTQRGYHANGSIAIDVWLVKASKEKPMQTMIESLVSEKKIYQEQLEIAQKEEKDATNSQKIRNLEHALKIFSQLVDEANDSVYHKKPDEQFLEIARNNFAQPNFAKYKPDMKNYLYLGGLSRYEER